MDYVLSLDKDNEGYNRLPADAAAAIGKIVEQAKTL